MLTVNCLVSPATECTPEVYTGTRPSYTLRNALQPPPTSIEGAPSTVTCVKYKGFVLIRMFPERSPEK